MNLDVTLSKHEVALLESILEYLSESEETDFRNQIRYYGFDDEKYFNEHGILDLNLIRVQIPQLMTHVYYKTSELYNELLSVTYGG